MENETKPLPEFDENSENVSGPKNQNQNSGLGRVIKKMKLKPKDEIDVLKKGNHYWSNLSMYLTDKLKEKK